MRVPILYLVGHFRLVVVNAILESSALVIALSSMSLNARDRHKTSQICRLRPSPAAGSSLMVARQQLREDARQAQNCQCFHPPMDKCEHGRERCLTKLKFATVELNLLGQVD